MRTRTKHVLLTLTSALAVSLPLGLTVTAADAAPRADDPSLAQAAALNGMSESRLSEILATDATARLDKTGRLYYVDPAPVVAAASVDSETEAAPFPLGQTFLLHSKPASDLTIYLDFNGTDVTNTAWNQTPAAQRVLPRLHHRRRRHHLLRRRARAHPERLAAGRRGLRAVRRRRHHRGPGRRRARPHLLGRPRVRHAGPLVTPSTTRH